MGRSQIRGLQTKSGRGVHDGHKPVAGEDDLIIAPLLKLGKAPTPIFRSTPPSDSMTKTPPYSSHKWHADRAGELPEHDKLGRKDFAARVAKELRGWHHKDSLVLSLNGDWGSGKTTLVNLILHYIREQSKAAKEKPPNVVRFNPWQWSGQDKMLAAFFDEIGAGFRKELIGKAKAKKLEHLWNGLKIVTMAGKELASRIRESMTALAAFLAAGSGILASVFHNPTLKHCLAVIGVILLGVSAACAICAPIAEKIAEILGWLVEKPDQTLEDVRAKLRDELETLDAPVIVVIDDMDRLNKREVRMLVQLVKANADFPNVVYFLLYQKSIVARALEEVTSEGGQDFLKKIVQVELEVPTAPEHEMRRFFTDEIGPVVERAVTRWDKDRWERIFEDTVWPWFQTPRDIKRFKSMLEFYYEAHVVDGVLEVNPIDLILVEILRMFDPVAYEMVGQAFQNQRNLFVEYLFEDEDAKKRFAEAVNKLVERKDLDENAQGRLRAVLVSLFPQARSKAAFSGQEKLDWDRDLRICHAKHFPRYFQLGGNPGDVTASFLNRLFTAGNDRTKLRELVKATFESGTFHSLMDRVRAIRKDVPSALIEPLITALFDLSDDLPPPPSRSYFESDSERELTRIVVLLLAQIEDKSERLAILRQAALASSTVIGPVMAAAFLEPERDDPNPDKERPVDLSGLKALQSELLPRLWDAAKTGRIWSFRPAGYLLYRLRNWAGIAEVKAWLTPALREPNTAKGFLMAMLGESQVSGGNKNRTEYALYGVRLEEFVDLEYLATNLPANTSDLLEQRTIEKLREAIARKNADQPYAEIYVMSRDPSGNLFVDPSPAR